MVKELFKKIYINTLNPLGRTEGVEYYTTLACLYKQGLLDEGSLTTKEKENIKKVIFMVEREENTAVENNKFRTYPGDIRLFRIGDFPEIYLLANAIVIAGPHEYVYSKKVKSLLYSLEYNPLTREELISLIEELGSLVYLYNMKRILRILKISGSLPTPIIQEIRKQIENLLSKVFEKELVNI